MTRFIFIISFLVLFLCSCEDKVAQEQQWINDTIESKLDDYIRKKNLDCRKNLLIEVQATADSIMIVQSRLDIPDSLSVPDKRLRPGKPSIEFPNYEQPREIIQQPVDSTVTRN